MKCLWTLLPEKPIKTRALYRCVCGVERWVVIRDITQGKSNSCGCTRGIKSSEATRIANTKHGATYTPEWNAWVEFRRRCRAKHRHDSKNYSERGLTVDPRWEVFTNFFEDMGDRPEGCSLDRIDNDKGYYKDNCRWATRKEQERNKRSNRLITIFCETLPVSAACEFFEVSANTVYQRLNRGWPPEKALLQW